MNERDELLEAFYYFDVDRKGFLSVDQLNYILSNLGNPLPPAEVEEFIREAAPNGQVNYADFVDVIYSSNQQ